MMEDACRPTLCVGCVTLATAALMVWGGSGAAGQEPQREAKLARAAALALLMEGVPATQD